MTTIDGDALAAAVVYQLRYSRTMITSLGGSAYAFAHRSFLEHYRAMDIAFQFESERTMTEDALQELFVQCCRDESWAPTLHLLTSMLNPSVVGQCLRGVALHNVDAAVRLVDSTETPLLVDVTSRDGGAPLTPRYCALASGRGLVLFSH